MLQLRVKLLKTTELPEFSQQGISFDHFHVFMDGQYVFEANQHTNYIPGALAA